MLLINVFRQLQQVISPLFLAKHWLWVIFTLLVFGGLIKLSHWQHQRAQEKSARLTRIAEYSQQQALSLNELAVLQKRGEQINDLPLALTGQFIQGQSLLLDNQVHQGQLGYRVLQLFVTDFGNVLVNLGWIKGSKNRDYIPEVTDFQGRISITGNVRLVELGVMLTPQQFIQGQWPQRIQQIELDKIAELYQVELMPFVLYLDQGQSIGFTKQWQPIVMPPEKHQAYAFQWFCLAIAWLVLMLTVAVKVSSAANSSIASEE